MTNTEQPTAQGSTKTASAIKKSNQRTSFKKKPDNSTPTASNSDNNTNSVIVPEGYTFISGGEIVSSEEWLEANLKQKKSESQIEKTAVTAENLTYDIRLTAEDRGHLEKISKLLVEHGITDQFIVANEGSYNLFLGRFTRLQNAADHRNKINSITGLSPEIVRKTMTQNTGSLPH